MAAPSFSRPKIAAFASRRPKRTARGGCRRPAILSNGVPPYAIGARPGRFPTLGAVVLSRHGREISARPPTLELIGVLPPRAASLPQYFITAMFVGAKALATSNVRSARTLGGGAILSWQFLSDGVDAGRVAKAGAAAWRRAFLNLSLPVPQRSLSATLLLVDGEKRFVGRYSLRDGGHGGESCRACR